MRDLYDSMFSSRIREANNIVYKKDRFLVTKRLSFDAKVYYRVLMLVTPSHYIEVGGAYSKLETVKGILDKDRPLVYL